MKLSHSSTICPLQVLSELLSDLEACDLQKGDSKVLANGEVAPGKFVVYQNIYGWNTASSFINHCLII